MNFDYNEEDRLIRNSVRDMLNDWSNIQQVRSFMADQTLSDDLKKMVGEMGILGVLNPDKKEGELLGVITAILIAREAGRAIFAYPLLEGIVGLYALKHDVSRKDLIQSVEDEKKLLTIAWEDSSPRATSEGDSWFVSGKLRYVPFADQSDVILANIPLAGTGNTRAAENTLVIINRNDPAVSVRSMNSMDETYPIYEVTLSNYKFNNKDTINGLGMGNDNGLFKKMQDIGALLLASEMSGGGEKALEETVKYTKIRKQYGKEISNFQAVQHIAADMWVMVENMKVAVDYTAWAVESENDNWETDVAVTKSYASDAYMKVTGNAIQLHGGIGFTSEGDMQLFFKRARRNASFLGDGYERREQLARIILDNRLQGPVYPTRM
ncbi:MAG: acyl-CoA dehydrogenase family protein [Bacillota bacterium]